MIRINLISITLTIFFSYLNGVDIDNNDFMSTEEYGKMLYQNPRGIGCSKCHGDDGEGKYIGKYKPRRSDEYVSIHVSPLKEVSYENFVTKVNGNSDSIIMPSYFLTKEELDSIYFYLQTLNKSLEN